MFSLNFICYLLPQSGAIPAREPTCIAFHYFFVRINILIFV